MQQHLRGYGGAWFLIVVGAIWLIDRFHKDRGLEAFLVLIALGLMFYGSYVAARRRIEARRIVEHDQDEDEMDEPDASRGGG